MKKEHLKAITSSIRNSEKIQPTGYLRYFSILVIYIAFSGIIDTKNVKGKTPGGKPLKPYIAKIYFTENEWVKGILYSVNDTSISIGSDSSSSGNLVIPEDSLQITTIPYSRIWEIRLIRKGSPETGAAIGAGSGFLFGLLVGVVIDVFAQLGEEVLTLGAADTHSNSSIIVVSGLTMGVIGGAAGFAGGSAGKKYTIGYDRERFRVEKENLQQYSLQSIADHSK